MVSTKYGDSPLMTRCCEALKTKTNRPGSEPVQFEDGSSLPQPAFQAPNENLSRFSIKNKIAERQKATEWYLLNQSAEGLLTLGLPFEAYDHPAQSQLLRDFHQEVNPREMASNEDIAKAVSFGLRTSFRVELPPSAEEGLGVTIADFEEFRRQNNGTSKFTIAQKVLFRTSLALLMLESRPEEDCLCSVYVQTMRPGEREQPDAAYYAKSGAAKQFRQTKACSKKGPEKKYLYSHKVNHMIGGNCPGFPEESRMIFGCCRRLCIGTQWCGAKPVHERLSKMIREEHLADQKNRGSQITFFSVASATTNHIQKTTMKAHENDSVSGSGFSYSTAPMLSVYRALNYEDDRKPAQLATFNAVSNYLLSHQNRLTTGRTLQPNSTTSSIFYPNQFKANIHETDTNFDESNPHHQRKRLNKPGPMDPTFEGDVLRWTHLQVTGKLVKNAQELIDEFGFEAKYQSQSMSRGGSAHGESAPKRRKTESQKDQLSLLSENTAVIYDKMEHRGQFPTSKADGVSPRSAMEPHCPQQRTMPQDSKELPPELLNTRVQLAARHSPARFGSAKHGSARQSTDRHGSARHGVHGVPHTPRGTAESLNP